MKKELRHSKIYKKLVYAMAMVYVFFVVLKRKPKYLVGFLCIALVAVSLIVLAVVEIKKLEPSDRYSDNSENNSDVVEENVQHDASDSFWSGSLKVDMSQLRDENPAVLGLVYFEAEKTVFPVLHADGSGSFELNSSTGIKILEPVLLETENSDDFSDERIYIYSYNMAGDPLYNLVEKYVNDKEYYNNHRYIQVVTYDKSGSTLKRRYRIFACNENDDTDIFFMNKIAYETSKDYADALMQDDNYIVAGGQLDIQSDSRLITIATSAFDKKRLILTAVEVAESLEK